MTTYRKGDRGTIDVTLECGGPDGDGDLLVRTYISNGTGCTTCVSAEAFTLTERALPQEPPMGAVIRDASNTLWTNDGGCVGAFLGPYRWVSFVSGGVNKRSDWEGLLRDCGPVAILVPGETVGYDQ